MFSISIGPVIDPVFIIKNIDGVLEGYFVLFFIRPIFVIISFKFWHKHPGILRVNFDNFSGFSKPWEDYKELSFFIAPQRLYSRNIEVNPLFPPHK